MSTYRIYKVTVDKVIKDEGATVERNHGCDGVNHVDSILKVFHEPGSDKVTFAQDVCVEEKGACDGTCSPKRLGEFVYPVLAGVPTATA